MPRAIGNFSLDYQMGCSLPAIKTEEEAQLSERILLYIDLLDMRGREKEKWLVQKYEEWTYVEDELKIFGEHI